MERSQLVQIAAILLSGRHDAEPRHIKATLATARALLEQASLTQEREEVAAQPERAAPIRSDPSEPFRKA